MDSGFLQKLLSYVLPTGGIGPLSAKIYYTNTAGNWFNSATYISGYAARFSGFSDVDVVGGKNTAAGDSLVDWGSQLGSSWVNNGALALSYIFGVTYGASTYVLVGDAGKVFTSSGGITWTPQTGGVGTNNHRSVNFLNSQFVATSYGGGIATSPTGVTWTTQTSSFGSTDVWATAYGAATYVAVGDSGKTASSPDSVVWTQRTNTFGTTLILDVEFGAGLFVAVGGAGKMSTSPDGVTWTSRTSSFGTTDIYGVGFGASKFVAVGNTGKIATSTDGITWQQQTSGITDRLNQVHYLAGMWVACGAAGVILTSPDGVTWTNWQTSTPFYSGPNTIFDVASNGTSLVAVGETNITAISEAGAFVSNTTLAGVIVDQLGTGAVGSLLPFSDASTPSYSAGTPPPSITVGQITLAFGGQPQYLGDYIADTILTAVDDGVGTGSGYLATAATCRLLSAYTSSTSFTEITAAQYSSYARQTCSITVTGSTLANTEELFFTIYGSSPTAPTITHAAIFDSSDRVIMCAPLPTPIARTDYIRDITIAAGSMQLNLNPTQTSTPV